MAETRCLRKSPEPCKEDFRSTKTSGKIVIIDDQKTFTIGAKGVLQWYGGYDVEVFSGHNAVKSAINYYTQNEAELEDVDLFIVDLRINGSDNGAVFIKWLKENKHDNKWIIHTGCDTTDEKYYELGRNIDKDFDDHVYLKGEYEGKTLLVALVKSIINYQTYPKDEVKERIEIILRDSKEQLAS